MEISPRDLLKLFKLSGENEDSLQYIHEEILKRPISERDRLEEALNIILDSNEDISVLLKRIHQSKETLKAFESELNHYLDVISHQLEISEQAQHRTNQEFIIYPIDELDPLNIPSKLHNENVIFLTQKGQAYFFTEGHLLRDKRGALVTTPVEDTMFLNPNPTERMTPKDMTQRKNFIDKTLIKAGLPNYRFMPTPSMHYHLQLKKNASIAKDNLEKFCKKIKGKSKHKQGIDIKIASVKKDARAIQKIVTKFHGNSKKITDLARGSMIFSSMNELRSTLEDIKESLGKNVLILDRFETPTETGYRDVKLLFTDPDSQQVIELQLHLKSIYDIQHKQHDIYEEIRHITAKAKEEGRELTEEESDYISDKHEESRNMYEQAYQQGLDNDIQSEEENDDNHFNLQ